MRTPLERSQAQNSSQIRLAQAGARLSHARTRAGVGKAHARAAKAQATYPHPDTAVFVELGPGRGGPLGSAPDFPSRAREIEEV
jgi:hypothetical protein